MGCGLETLALGGSLAHTDILIEVNPAPKSVLGPAGNCVTAAIYQSQRYHGRHSKYGVLRGKGSEMLSVLWFDRSVGDRSSADVDHALA